MYNINRLIFYFNFNNKGLIVALKLMYSPCSVCSNMDILVTYPQTILDTNLNSRSLINAGY